MPRPPRAKQPLKEAALERFVNQGVHGTGIREIAERAGCSEAALYRHWSNKDDLVKSLYTEHLADVNALLEEALGGEGGLADQVRAAAGAVYRLYDEQPLVFRFVLLVQHEISPLITHNTVMPQDILTRWLEAHVDAGTVRGDPLLLSAALIGIFLWTAQYVVYERIPGPLSRYRNDVTDEVLRLLEVP